MSFILAILRTDTPTKCHTIDQSAIGKVWVLYKFIQTDYDTSNIDQSFGGAGQDRELFQFIFSGSKTMGSC